MAVRRAAPFVAVAETLFASTVCADTLVLRCPNVAVLFSGAVFASSVASTPLSAFSVSMLAFNTLSSDFTTANSCESAAFSS